MDEEVDRKGKYNPIRLHLQIRALNLISRHLMVMVHRIITGPSIRHGGQASAPFDRLRDRYPPHCQIITLPPCPRG